MENKFKAVFQDFDDFDLTGGTATAYVEFEGLDLGAEVEVRWDFSDFEYNFDRDGDPESVDIGDNFDTDGIKFVDTDGDELTVDALKARFNFTDEDLDELKKAAAEEAIGAAFSKAEDEADDESYWPSPSDIEADRRAAEEDREFDIWWEENH